MRYALSGRSGFPLSRLAASHLRSTGYEILWRKEEMGVGIGRIPRPWGGGSILGTQKDVPRKAKVAVWSRVSGVMEEPYLITPHTAHRTKMK